MKNPVVGERVMSKEGLHDPGKIKEKNSDGSVKVEWHYQDGSKETSNRVDPKTLKRDIPKTCDKCGRAL